MTVPFQAFAGNICIVLQTVNDTCNRAGHGSFGIGNAVAHCIAGTDLNRNTCLAAQSLQLIDKGNNESIEVCSGDVLQMAARDDTCIESILNGTQIVVQTLLTGHLHFFEDVIVGAADQNTGFLNAKVFDELKVFLTCTNPAGNFGEFQIEAHALFKCFTILFAVDEELGLTDDTVRAAQLIQQLIDINNLINAVRFH